MPELESGSKKNTAELNKGDIEKMEEGRDQKWQLRKMMSFCIVGHLAIALALTKQTKLSYLVYKTCM